MNDTMIVQVHYRDGEIGNYECVKVPFVNYKTTPTIVHLELVKGVMLSDDSGSSKRIVTNADPCEILIPMDQVKIISY